MQLILTYSSKDEGQSASVRDSGTGIFFVGQSHGMWDGWQVWIMLHHIRTIEVNVSEPHLSNSTCPLSVCIIRTSSFWSRRGPRTTHKRKPAH